MTKKIDNIMCKETEKLVKLLQGRDNPTDMALLILANKIDILDSKLNSLNQSTELARWLESHKKKIVSVLIVLIVLALFGLPEAFDMAKTLL